MLILALDAALARCSAALLEDDRLLAHAAAEGPRAQASALPPMVDRVLRQAGLAAPALGAVAVGVGPGGFTGLRAAIALAEGLALGAGLPLVGATTGEALAAALPADGRAVWAAIDARRGRIILERPGAPPLLLEREADLPDPAGPVLLAGDAAPRAAARLAARGRDAALSDARQPDAASVGRVAARRLAGALPPLAVAPLYVEPPALRPPA
jgi:tRNA threonylcarbamoyladenosine biosynthesis protein TsaB